MTIPNHRPLEPLAIVGMGCRFPGGADSPELFWELIARGDVVIREVPPERWDARRFYDPEKEAAGRTFAWRAGFLDWPIDKFDAAFFGISPREAAPLDPQQRILLEVTWEAFAAAGLPIDRLFGERVGVFVGAFGVDNQLVQMNRGGRYLAGSYTIAGCSAAMLSNRISYTFGFTGPSLTIDTACSSSLVALHYAAQSLWSGESELALAAGVNLMFHPDFAIGLAKARFLSPDGRSKAFDASADGYGRGEGAGVIVLKRLSAALADGDPIRALIRGTGVNQDGQTPGITVPSGEAQTTLMREVCRQASVNPAQIRYVEAHGTGTPVGDPIEARAIGEAIGIERDPLDECFLGSLKTNMGHLEAAAGIAGVIKAALCLEHKQIPPHPLPTGRNPNIPFSDLKLRLSERLAPWPSASGAAMAAVNSFGFGGTNAHAVLQESPVRTTLGGASSENERPGRPHLLTLSAASETALGELARAHREAASRRPADLTASIRDLCYSASVRATHLPHRATLVVDTRESLTRQLAAYQSGESAPGVRSGVCSSTRTDRPVFVYSGMGPQWWGMGRELLADEPVFRAVVEQIDSVFRPLAGWSLLEEMGVPESESRVALTEVAQPLNFAVQAGLTALWKSWGIEPSAVVGHSVGEVAAGYAAGVLDLEDAVLVSYHRSRLQGTLRGKGAMLAVGLSAEQAKAHLNGLSDRVSIAAINSPGACTLAGDTAALEEIASALTASGIFNRFLKVDIAYHSPQMAPIEAKLLEALGSLRPREARIPLYSTVSGRRSSGSEWNATYWWRNVRQPVLFADAVGALAADGHELYLEVGPHPVLATSVVDVLRGLERTGLVLPSLKRQQPERPAMLDTLGALHIAGFPIDWHKLFPGGGRFLRLPDYPWQRERHWCESIESREDRLGGGGHPLLDLPSRSPNPTWHADLNPTVFPYLDDHRIEGTPIFPGAGYLEACLAATLEFERHSGGAIVIEEIAFKKAMVLGTGRDVILHTTFDPRERLVSVHSRTRDSSAWELNAQARVLERTNVTEPVLAVDVVEIHGRCADRQDTTELYERLAARGLQYGPLFQGIKELWIGKSEVVARLAIAPALESGLDRYFLHPVLVDGSFQALLAAAGSDREEATDGSSATFLPVEIGRVRYHGRSGGSLWCHGQLTKATADVLIGDIILFDDAGAVVAEIHGFKCQALASARASEIDRSASWLYDVAWRPLPDPRVGAADNFSSRDGASTRQRASLVFADKLGTASALAARLRAEHHMPIIVRKGRAAARIDGGAFQIDPSRPEHFDWLLEQCQADADLVNILYLPGLEIDRPSDTSDLSDKQAGLTDATALMKLVQAVDRAGATIAPRLWIVTRGGAQADADDQEIIPGQMALWGLARVIDVEHPRLRTTVVDLDPSCPASTDQVDLLAAEIVADGPESEVAFRQQSRRGARVISASSAFDDAGVRAQTVDATTPYRLEVRRLGSFDNLVLRECERRPPGPGEVEIRVAASGLNYKDVLKVMGVLSDSVVQNTWSGKTLGLECSGTIVHVGPGVSTDRIGEEVQGWVSDGFRSYITARADQFGPRFAGLTLEQAAAAPVVFLTAYYGLIEIGRLKAGESVLIHAATGGVGLAAIQVARAVGARVFATAGSEEKREYLRAMGIEHVMNSRTLAFADEVMHLTDGRGVDVVLNSLTGAALVKSVSVLAPYGRFIEIGKRDIDADNAIRLKPFNRNLLFAAIDLDRLLVDRPADVARLEGELAALFDNGVLGPLPVKAYPAGETAEAFRFLAQARHIGKVVITHGHEPAPVAPAPRPSFAVRRDATYLITGGLGGFGLETARWLADHGATSLALVSRSGARTQEANDAVAQLRSAGVRVKVAAIDVNDSQQVATLVAEIAATLPPLRGVFHAAMVLDDDLLVRLDEGRFRAAMDPKTIGAWYLHIHTFGQPLDVFVMYSSMVAVMGNLGQSSYSAANSFMDALARHRRSRGLPGLSVNWGSLAEAGFVARNPAIARHLERTGLIGIPARRALDMLPRLLALEHAQIGVARVDWSAWEKSAPALARRPRFAEVLSASASGDGDSSGSPAHAWLKALRATAPDDRLAFASTALREIFARVLRLPATSIETHQNINQLGIDSLMAVELQTLIAAQTGASFSTMDFMAGPTLSTMAGRLLDKVLTTEEATPHQDAVIASTVESATAPDIAQREEVSSVYPNVDDVDLLSEFEVDQLLVSLLNQEIPR
jgi:acyl transferase domain-containing protein/NAD(P)-dependent dehydrogenase (short-subunit alcohol dehydrogenase family)/acyl carrier protein